jgi:DNA repair exonuclease SbcCD ATPase subunit
MPIKFYFLVIPVICLQVFCLSVESEGQEDVETGDTHKVSNNSIKSNFDIMRQMLNGFDLRYKMIEPDLSDLKGSVNDLEVVVKDLRQMVDGLKNTMDDLSGQKLNTQNERIEKNLFYITKLNESLEKNKKKQGNLSSDFQLNIKRLNSQVREQAGIKKSLTKTNNLITNNSTKVKNSFKKLEEMIGLNSKQIKQNAENENRRFEEESIKHKENENKITKRIFELNYTKNEIIKNINKNSALNKRNFGKLNERINKNSNNMFFKKLETDIEKVNTSILSQFKTLDTKLISNKKLIDSNLIRLDGQLKNFSEKAAVEKIRFELKQLDKANKQRSDGLKKDIDNIKTSQKKEAKNSKSKEKKIREELAGLQKKITPDSNSGAPVIISAKEIRLVKDKLKVINNGLNSLKGQKIYLEKRIGNLSNQLTKVNEKIISHDDFSCSKDKAANPRFEKKGMNMVCDHSQGKVWEFVSSTSNGKFFPIWDLPDRESLENFLISYHSFKSDNKSFWPKLEEEFYWTNELRSDYRTVVRKDGQKNEPHEIEKTVDGVLLIYDQKQR